MIDENDISRMAYDVAVAEAHAVAHKQSINNAQLFNESFSSLCDAWDKHAGAQIHDEIQSAFTRCRKIKSASIAVENTMKDINHHVEGTGEDE